MAIVGHRGSGKTSLSEALLFEAGATTRLGAVADGSTVFDSEPDEVEREMSISAGLASFEHEQGARSRHERRAENSFLRLLDTVQRGTGLSSQARAATALSIVLGAICRRLTMVDRKAGKQPVGELLRRR